MYFFNWIILLTLTLVFATGENFCWELIRDPYWHPDFIAILLVWVGYTYPLSLSALMSIMVGVIRDGFMGTPVGTSGLYSLALIYVGLMIGGRLHPLLIGLITAISSVLISLILSSLLFEQDEVSEYVYMIMLSSIFITTLIAPLILKIINLVHSPLISRSQTQNLLR